MPPKKRVEHWTTVARSKRLPAGGMYEKEFTQAVMDLCQLLGLYAYHTHDSRHSTSGFPDVVIIAPGGVMYRELKTENGHLRKDQAEVLELLRMSGQDAGVWRPSDLALGNIIKELRELKQRRKDAAGN